jgi:hypothetical protein
MSVGCSSAPKPVTRPKPRVGDTEIGLVACARLDQKIEREQRPEHRAHGQEMDFSSGETKSDLAEKIQRQGPKRSSKQKIPSTPESASARNHRAGKILGHTPTLPWRPRPESSMGNRTRQKNQHRLGEIEI